MVDTQYGAGHLTHCDSQGATKQTEHVLVLQDEGYLNSGGWFAREGLDRAGVSAIALDAALMSTARRCRKWSFVSPLVDTGGLLRGGIAPFTGQMG
jgi:hypothetical protein